MNNVNISSKGIISTAVRLICLAAVFVMLFISIHAYGASVSGLMILTLFILFYVQLPGQLVLRAAGLRPDHLSTTLALGLFSGWVLNIVVYFLADWLHSVFILYVVSPVMALALLLILFRERQAGESRFHFRISSIPPAFCVFFVLILFYCIVNTQYLYLSPEISKVTYMNPDKAYHIGLINSLSHDYPLESPWISGIYINYHIFSEMLMSIPVRLFDVPADLVTLSFGPFFTAYTFGLSMYSFFREMSSKPKRAGLYCVLLVLSNIYISRSANSSLAFKFILINDNSAGYGMAAALMTIILFREWYKSFTAKEPNRWKLLVLLTLFIMVTAGIKGPMGAVTLAGIWGTMLLGVILRKVSPKTLPSLLVISAGFYLVYVTVLGSKGQSNASGNSVITFGTITDVAYWKKPLTALLKSYDLPVSVRLAILMAVFIAFFLTVFLVPFCIGYLRELFVVLSGRKAFEPAKVLVYAEFAVGFVAMFLLNYSGHSQVYFGLVAAFLAPMVAFWFIEDLEALSDSSGLARHTLRITLLISAVILIYTSYTLGVYYNRHAKEAAAAFNQTRDHSKYESISHDEYEAMRWIEENTEDDALLAIDRYYSVSPDDYTYQNRWANRFFLYAVYSNRFSYISGSGYNLPAYDWPVRMEMIKTNDQLYDVSNEERGELARDLDIDYVVVSKRFSGSPDLANDDYELCYSNDEVDIYEIDD